MKNLKKMIALCALSVLLITLSGCAFSTFDMTTPLATQRAEHGIWQEKNKSILYQDNLYLRLEYTDYLYIDDLRSICVTAPDVPLLLREWQGDWLQCSEDGKLISDSNGYGNTYYCRKDCYKEYSERLSKPFKPAVYGYEYLNQDWETAFEKISAQDEKLLFDIRKTATPFTAPQDVFDVAASPNDLKVYEGNGYGIVATIDACSEDLLQRKQAAISVLMQGKKFFLAFEGDKLYPVPEQNYEDIRRILSRLLENPDYPQLTDC